MALWQLWLLVLVFGLLGFAAINCLCGLGYAIYLFILGIKQIKRGNPILFIVIACIGVILLLIQYYFYFDELNGIYKYADGLQMYQAEGWWESWRPSIILSWCIFGVGAVGTFVKRHKKSKQAILFNVIACIGVILLLMQYYFYFDGLGSIYKTNAFLKGQAESHWESWRPSIIFSWCIFGVGAVGTLVVYLIKKYKKSKEVPGA